MNHCYMCGIPLGHPNMISPGTFCTECRKKVDNQCPKKELCTMSETCHHYSPGFEPCKWDYYLNRKNELFKSKGETK